MLYSLQRWWSRSGRQVLLAAIVLGLCLAIRHSKGAVLYELFAVITKPFNLASRPTVWERDADQRQLETLILELDQQNRRLRDLIGETERTSPRRVTARIIARSADNWWQEVTISQGSNSGIVEGSAVLATGKFVGQAPKGSTIAANLSTSGLVGRVIKVTPNTSQVLLLSDPKTRIGVKISRIREQGLIRGIADNRVKVRFFKRDPDVKPGDVVVTSSNSTQFPEGLPIGTVQSYEPRAQPLPEAIVQLHAVISQLEWVSVIPLDKANGTPSPAQPNAAVTQPSVATPKAEGP
jgi:rod shape-determining protein MreC